MFNGPYRKWVYQTIASFKWQHTVFVKKTANELFDGDNEHDTVWPAFTRSLNLPDSTTGGARLIWSAPSISWSTGKSLKLNVERFDGVSVQIR